MEAAMVRLRAAMVHLNAPSSSFVCTGTTGPAVGAEEKEDKMSYTLTTFLSFNPGPEWGRKQLREEFKPAIEAAAEGDNDEIKRLIHKYAHPKASYYFGDEQPWSMNLRSHIVLAPAEMGLPQLALLAAGMDEETRERMFCVQTMALDDVCGETAVAAVYIGYTDSDSSRRRMGIPVLRQMTLDGVSTMRDEMCVLQREVDGGEWKDKDWRDGLKFGIKHVQEIPIDPTTISLLEDKIDNMRKDAHPYDPSEQSVALLSIPRQSPAMVYLGYGFGDPHHHQCSISHLHA